MTSDYSHVITKVWLPSTNRSMGTVGATLDVEIERQRMISLKSNEKNKLLDSTG